MKILVDKVQMQMSSSVWSLLCVLLYIFSNKSIILYLADLGYMKYMSFLLRYHWWSFQSWRNTNRASSWERPKESSLSFTWHQVSFRQFVELNKDLCRKHVVILVWLLCSGHDVRCCLWGKYAEQFEPFIEDNNVETLLCLIRFAKISFYQGIYILKFNNIFR